MELHINEKLAKQPLDDLFEERRGIDANDRDKQVEQINRLINELVMNAMFIAPVTFPNGTESGDVTFGLLRNAENVNYFPLFTNSDELAKWEGNINPQTIQLPFDQYAEMMNAREGFGGIVVNPFSDNFAVEKKLVLEWYEQKQMALNGYANHTITKDTQYEFFAPNPYPLQLSGMLCETARAIPEVNRLWFRGVKLDGRDAYLVVVDFDGDRSKILTALGENVKDFLNGMPLHVVQLQKGFAEEAVENVIPIYTK